MEKEKENNIILTPTDLLCIVDMVMNDDFKKIDILDFITDEPVQITDKLQIGTKLLVSMSVIHGLTNDEIAEETYKLLKGE
jgi:hypothetical protein